MDSTIEQVKSKIDIVELIGSFITLKKAGRNFKANCPFHNEKSPSFVVSPDRQIWHCFGSCGDGGDVIKFMMKWENITFHEALVELARKAGVQIKSFDVVDKDWDIKEKITKMNYLAAEFFQYVLHKTKYGEKALEYLVGRNINPKIIETFEIGYSPVSWDSLLLFLKKKNYSYEDMYTAGLVIKSEYGKYYDRFRGRIMFPIKDVKGNIIGFSGRVIVPDEKGAKYMNTPETPIYHKRESLYGIHLTKESIRKSNSVMLVEGEFDLIMPYQHGFENIVAIKGSALTIEQLTILKRYTTKLIFSLDADEAGVEAIKRGVREAEKLDFEIYAVELTSGKDPDEAVQKDPVAFKKAIQSPLPIYDFIIQSLQKKYKSDDPFFKKKMGEEVVPFISHIINPIVLAHYVKKIADMLEVPEDSIRAVIRNQKKFIKRPAYVAPIPDKQKHSDRLEMIQKYILSLLLQSTSAYSLADSIFSILQPVDFLQPSFQKIAQEFLNFREQNSSGFDTQKFFQFIPAELRTLTDEVFLYGSAEEELSSQGADTLAKQLKTTSIKHRISDLLSHESNVSDEEKNKQLAVLQEELKRVEKTLNTM